MSLIVGAVKRIGTDALYTAQTNLVQATFFRWQPSERAGVQEGAEEGRGGRSLHVGDEELG